MAEEKKEKTKEEEKVEIIVTSRPKRPLLSQVLSSYNIEALKKMLGEKLIIIEE